jgi:hypothetical protein
MTDVVAPNERDLEIHEAFLSLACAILCFRNAPFILKHLLNAGAAPKRARWRPVEPR